MLQKIFEHIINSELILSENFSLFKWDGQSNSQVGKYMCPCVHVCTHTQKKRLEFIPKCYLFPGSGITCDFNFISCAFGIFKVVRNEYMLPLYGGGKLLSKSKIQNNNINDKLKL